MGQNPTGITPRSSPFRAIRRHGRLPASLTKKHRAVMNGGQGSSGRSRALKVYMVRHVRHAKFLNGLPTRHRGEDGEFIWDEEDGDDLKELGIYATQEEAEARIQRARDQEGFRDEPDCFMIDEYVLGEDFWTEGFVSIPYTDRPPTKTAVRATFLTLGLGGMALAAWRWLWKPKY